MRDALSNPQARLPSPYRPEHEALAEVAQASALALPSLHGGAQGPGVLDLAGPWVRAVRERPAPFWALESLLREYPISSAEGLALMRLAEALLRVPDAETAIALTADQLGRAAFDGDTTAEGPHRLLAQLSASAIALSKKFLPEATEPAGLLQRLGARTVVAATLRAVQLLGRQFVLGRDIAEALSEADAQRAQAAHTSQQATRCVFSFDMLGEGARTEADALRYLASYQNALAAIHQHASRSSSPSPRTADGISIKLSALFSRYEELQRGRVAAVLLPRVLSLVDQAAAAQLNLTIDAEESDRLELSLDLLEALARHVAQRHPQWQGLGLAVQAYQTRALAVVDAVARIARQAPCPGGLRFMVRLVKGAYWDSEVKRAQEGGLAAYPVFTHKPHTDLSYLACAARLFEHRDVLYPQFATHNAGTVAAIVLMARRHGAPFELQRLHGMGEGVYREVLADAAVCGDGSAPPLRVYAPVGEHRDLLAYLVRRLLENGANSSFVHQLADEGISPEALLALPTHSHPDAAALPLPAALYGPGRANALGLDLACLAHRAPLQAAVAATRVAPLAPTALATIDPTVQRLHQGFEAWRLRPLAERAQVLRRAADALQADLPAFCGLLVKEAHKTLGDAVAEVREAIDFCRYYAEQAELRLADQRLPGPTGERNLLRLQGRGVFVCISPWNFPLAIFAGQVVAALVAGNSVAAKPAEQTPQVAARFVALLHAAGVPADALALLHGPGDSVGAALVAHPLAAGVCFTGSTAVSRHIHRALAAKDGPIVPLIAETGGLNAMVVDSSALAEQVIDAVVHSAFRSAGQRCSALRLLCLHEAVAEPMLAMLQGAMATLVLGDPADVATDVGPLIDARAHAAIAAEVQRLRREAKLVYELPLPLPQHTPGAEGTEGAHTQAQPAPVPHLLPPVAFELPRIAALRTEIFGPVLHIVRWGPGCELRSAEAVVAAINALGWGLTMGVHTRIDSRAERLASLARVGNVYVNRNMVGAVVGVQPFGGEGLSGTGPKAGGPHYLYRFCTEQTLTVNTAAAGGNAELLAGQGG